MVDHAWATVETLTPLTVTTRDGVTRDAVRVNVLSLVVGSRVRVELPRVGPVLVYGVDAAPTPIDTGFITSGIGTVQSGWSLNYQRGQIRAGIAFVGIEFVRTGGTITVPANGNLTNTLVFQLEPEWRQAVSPTNFTPGLSSTATGRVCTATITADGIISLAATTPGSDILDTDTLSLYGSWPVA